MKKKRKAPRPKAIDLVVRQSGKRRIITRAEGLLTHSPTGASFRGFDQDGNPAVADFPEWHPTTAGRPAKTAQEHMTAVLKNYLSVVGLDVGSREVAEEIEGRSFRTLTRAREAASKHIRIGLVCTFPDGRRLAVAFMHDGHDRGDERAGPAWVMWDGDEAAQFVANVRVEPE